MVKEEVNPEERAKLKELEKKTAKHVCVLFGALIILWILAMIIDGMLG